MSNMRPAFQADVVNDTEITVDDAQSGTARVAFDRVTLFFPDRADLVRLVNAIDDYLEAGEQE